MIPAWLLMSIVGALYAGAAIDHLLHKRWSDAIILVGFVIANGALAWQAWK